MRTVRTNALVIVSPMGTVGLAIVGNKAKRNVKVPVTSPGKNVGTQDRFSVVACGHQLSFCALRHSGSVTNSTPIATGSN